VLRSQYQDVGTAPRGGIYDQTRSKLLLISCTSIAPVWVSTCVHLPALSCAALVVSVPCGLRRVCALADRSVEMSRSRAAGRARYIRV
jgi:hypothetical protein